MYFCVFLRFSGGLVVGQQAKVVRQHTGLNVGAYYGEMNVDAWKPETWEAELEKKEVVHSPFALKLFSKHEVCAL